VGAIAINVIGLFDTTAPFSVQAIRVSVVLFGLTQLWFLRRRLELISTGRLVAGILLSSNLAVAGLRLNDGWPVSLNLVPLLVVFALLVTDRRFTNLLAALALTVVPGFYAIPGVNRPPYLLTQMTNYCIAVVAMLLLVGKVAQLLHRGSEDLTATVDLLHKTQRTIDELSFALSGRISRAVENLATALDVSLKHAVSAAEELARVLGESRTAIPPEPVVRKVALGQQLQQLRLRTMDWTLIVVIALNVVQLVRNATSGPRANIPAVAALLSLTSVLAALRLAIPRIRVQLNWVLIVGAYLISTSVLWTWYARAPISPPVLPTWLMGTVIVSLTVGSIAAIPLLVALCVVSFVALQVHPGIPWTTPLSLALGYGILDWTISRWPKDLLMDLVERRNSAAEGIRKRGRLVATLFHDLANPLQAVLGALDEMLEDGANAERLDDISAMIRRMRGTLSAALSDKMNVTEIGVAQICSDLEDLFRDRLRRKRLALRVTGAVDARVYCDEVLLRDSVLANLVSNAIKFSVEGESIELEIRKQAEGVVLLVKDRGPGLAQAVHSAFEHGVRAPSAQGTAGEEGTGYGLMLAKDYLLAMGGKLELGPREGGGLVARLLLRAA
jgi:signal transduction histidine kinase